MRKWSALVGVVLAAALTIVMLALVFGGPTAPFRFLEGRKRLDLPLSTQPGASESQIYTYKADFKSVLRTARSELTSAGYEETYDGPKEFEIAVFARSVGPREVRIYNNMRTAKTRTLYHYDEGWITVMVEEPPEQGFFERVRAFLGL